MAALPDSEFRFACNLEGRSSFSFAAKLLSDERPGFAEEDRLRPLVDLHKRTTYELDAIARDEADLATRRAIAKQVLDERMGLAS